MKSKLSWIALALIVVGALAIGSVRSSKPSLAAQTESLANSLRCPVCSGESIADSQAPVSKTIRADIEQRLQSGQSANEIKDYYVSKYGTDILLAPETSGASLMAWLIPLIGVLCAIALVVVLIVRWRVSEVKIASPEERSRAEEALGLK